MTARLPGRGRAAFSLVEITLSVGIFAFVLVAVFGLLGVGINAARDSGDDMKIGFIMQDVAARVRAETSNVDLLADPTKMDLTWNAAYNAGLSYTVLGKTTLPTDGAGQPQAAATAYYTVDGKLVKQSSAAAPTANYYKAAIYIQPLSSYPAPMSVSPATGYPFLTVTVRVGWPTDQTVNGNVLGAANTAKSIFAFYLLKP